VLQPASHQSLRPSSLALCTVWGGPARCFQDGHVDIRVQIHGTRPRYVFPLSRMTTPRITSIGTTRYFDDPERPQVATSESTGLKCDTSGPIPIILVPQPSDDPNDPLVSTGNPKDCCSTNSDFFRTGPSGSETLFSSSSPSSRSLRPVSALYLQQTL
jgi:hypothetical protein